MKPKVLILNGSLGGPRGNTSVIVEKMTGLLVGKNEVDVLHLAEMGSIAGIESNLRSASAFVFTTGTYWDSWGSPLQKFFEEATELEASDIWLGKPAAVIATMHSVGGKEVVSRLQGVLSSLGLLLPPMTAMIYSLANHLALKSGSEDPMAQDFWRLEDLEVVSTNLQTAVECAQIQKPRWKTWPIDENDPRRRWL